MKRLAFLFAFVFALAPSAWADDNPEAEAFVRENAAQVLEVLNNEGLTEAERSVQLTGVITDLINTTEFSRFVLGSHANADRNPSYDSQEALDTDIAAFNEVYLDYTVTRVMRILETSSGQSITVTGSTRVRNNPNDVIVHTVIAGGNASQSYNVDWRIRIRDGQPEVHDFFAEGYQFRSTERQTAFGKGNDFGGDIKLVTEHYRELLVETADN